MPFAGELIPGSGERTTGRGPRNACFRSFGLSCWCLTGTTKTVAGGWTATSYAAVWFTFTYVHANPAGFLICTLIRWCINRHQTSDMPHYDWLERELRIALMWPAAPLRSSSGAKPGPSPKQGGSRTRPGAMRKMTGTA